MAKRPAVAKAIEEITEALPQWAIEFHSECQERGVVERKVKLFAHSRCALEERRRGRSNDERQRFQVLDGLIQTGRIEIGF